LQQCKLFQSSRIRQHTTGKVCSLILEAGRNGADIIGFPEGVIPGHPGWVEVLPLSPEPAPALFLELFKQSAEVPRPEVDAIGAACKEANIFAIVGINPSTSDPIAIDNGHGSVVKLLEQKYVQFKLPALWNPTFNGPSVIFMMFLGICRSFGQVLSSLRVIRPHFSKTRPRHSPS